jgi:hypothetical protein
MGILINQGTNSATSEDWVTATRHQGIVIGDSQLAILLSSTSSEITCTHSNFGAEMMASRQVERSV